MKDILEEEGTYRSGYHSIDTKIAYLLESLNKSIEQYFPDKKKPESNSWVKNPFVVSEKPSKGKSLRNSALIVCVLLTSLIQPSAKSPESLPSLGKKFHHFL